MSLTHIKSHVPHQEFFASVYDGRTFIGSITAHNDEAFVAYDAADQQLDSFKTMLLAARAIPKTKVRK